MPFFSVIIPLYNKEDFVEQTINSLLHQSHIDYEVIIVNDGSTDNSVKKIESLIDNRFKIINQKNLGASHARNNGIKASKGNYVALLDADDFWHGDHLLELKKLIEKFPSAGLFCNNYEVKRNEDFITSATFNFSFSKDYIIIKDFFEASTITFIPTSSSVAFLKSTFYDVGTYNISLRTGQDIDLWIKLGLKYKVAFNPKITMTYNIYDDNSLSKSKYNSDRYQLINNYNEEEKTNQSLKKYLDINRYALALRCKINKEVTLYKLLKSEINFNNLNFKQKTLINCPKSFLKGIKLFQQFLIKHNIYLTAYK